MGRLFNRPRGWPQFRRGQIWNRLLGGYTQPTYAIRGPRTFQHAFYGTLPHGYRRGYHFYGGRGYAPMLADAMQRQVPNWVRTRRVTPWGRQAQSTMAQQKRDFRSETASKRREFRRGQRALKNQIRDWKKTAPILMGPSIDRLQAQLKSQGASYRSSYKQRLAKYRKQRRATATKRPMYAVVRRHPWYGYSGGRPTQSWWRRRRYA